ncbi:MAG: metal ABC transporter substrate-binding protein [Lachnospiraceae bacterium]|nr:metal ABC transporter substrate-binding protein [Lachnospiraceae bacterium]
MKKAFLYFFPILIVSLCLSGCRTGSADNTGEKEKLKIVATIFPEYDWVMNILGDNADGAEVTLLLDKGVDLHSYQPTAGDILKISSCNMFIYVGGESDAWIEDALSEAVNKEMTVISLMELTGDSAKEEEITEGMQDPEDEGEIGEDSRDPEKEYDEHVWLSLKNAAKYTGYIAEKLELADPGNAAAYRENAAGYIEKLNDLDRRFAEAVSEGSKDTLLFGDRFPFRYLTDDYGLSYYAAFPGCSAETEASFETVTFLAKKVNELSLHSVITIDGGDQKIAETIVKNTETGDQRILTMDSMQSVTKEDTEKGTTYLSVMENNLSVLSQALE